MMVVLLYFIETYPYVQEILHNADFRIMKHHVSSLFSSGSEKLHTHTLSHTHTHARTHRHPHTHTHTHTHTLTLTHTHHMLLFPRWAGIHSSRCLATLEEGGGIGPRSWKAEENGGGPGWRAAALSPGELQSH